MDHHDPLFTASAVSSTHSLMQARGQHSDTNKKRPSQGRGDGLVGKILRYEHENLDLDPQCHLEARHGMPRPPELGTKMSGSLGLTVSLSSRSVRDPVSKDKTERD